MKDPIYDITSSFPKWEKELNYLVSLARKTTADETIKWGNPCYMVNAKNVFILSPFKSFFTVNFFQGSLLKDAAQILSSHGENQKASRILKFTSLEEAKNLETLILNYMNEAISNSEKGLKIEKTKTSIDVCSFVETYLHEHPKLKSALALLTPGRQRAYMLFFCSAKSDDAKQRRILKYTNKIMQGKGMHDV